MPPNNHPDNLPPNPSQQLKAIRKALRLTQQELAGQLGIKRSNYANYETNRIPPPELLARARQLQQQNQTPEVGPPLVPASQLLIPIPYIGYIAASDPVHWTDPFESETFEFVPPEMGDPKGRFACRVASDSMMPFLEPGDTCVFQRTDVPRIGQIILFRSFENQATIKLLAHDGQNYVLKPLNPSYQATIAQGAMLGFLVGIVREKGSLRITLHDPSGLRP